MRKFSFLAAAISVVISVASAQDANITASLTAATTVVASASSAPSLFPVETIQLTDDFLADVAATIQNDTISSLFAFANSTNSMVSKRSGHSCKLMPGGFLWPVGLVWDIFDLLLGGRLIKTTPLAASCYTAWPEYNADTCATVTADWLLSNLQ